MQYEDALREWGARKSKEVHPHMKQIILKPSVEVIFSFNEGSICCGGTDPYCHCSMTESPSADVHIRAWTDKGDQILLDLPMSDYTGNLRFTEVLKEILEVGEGSISLE